MINQNFRLKRERKIRELDKNLRGRKEEKSKDSCW